jgi:hypothetical protein
MAATAAAAGPSVCATEAQRRLNWRLACRRRRSRSLRWCSCTIQKVMMLQMAMPPRMP